MAKFDPNEGVSFNLWSVLKVVGVLLLCALALYVLYKIQILFVLLFIAFILASSLRPVVNFLHARGWPMSLAALTTMFGLLIVIGLIIGFVLFPLSHQVDQFIRYLNSTEFSEQAGSFFAPRENSPLFNQTLVFVRNNFDQIFNSLSSSLGQINTGVQGVVDNAKKVFDLLIYSFAVFVFAWYMLIQQDQREYLLALTIKDSQRRQRIRHLINDIEKNMGRWLRGELTLMFIIGLMSYLVLIILHVPFALPLAILAGLLEMIPNVGPFASAVVTAPIVLLTNGWLAAIVMLLSYLVIQQLENYLLVPRVMQAAVGINAFVVLIGVFAGGLLFGIAGSLFAVPLMVIVQLLASFLREPQNRFW